ncbi:hypothetical protein B0T18DRAFT_427898 [Schizothecium vesticola]|uniref:Uncharacterized protein n=1 Tax=Schizothecium vesticola TaxID=314040 RepID=A0AA40F259_9PEZI|nr:hypothetical protein B0T18DRAFT_427898 [Schizothecium vesticola]
MTASANPTSSQCGQWIGVEIIYMVVITEICPEGASSTSTVTSVLSTLTRSICETSTANHPCYPCIMPTLSFSNHTVTVTRTSIESTVPPSLTPLDPAPTPAPTPTVTLTIQPCHTCATSTYIGSVPGYTPGAPCHGCVPYGEPVPIPTGGSGGDPGVAVPPYGGGARFTTNTASTTTTTRTTAVVVGGGDPGSGSGPSADPYGPGAGAGGSGTATGGVPGYEGVTPVPGPTPYRPSAGSGVVTAGGAREVKVWAGGVAAVVAVMLAIVA